MSDVMADRRVAPRYPLILVAEITESGESTVLSARSSDVSRTGCYIDTLSPPPVGAQVQVRLLEGDKVFRAAARVMYVCPGLGMGVAFHENVAADQMAILDGWLKQAASGT
jgi:hypothetical protein